ncbi:MAG TPA: aminotransferase class I/II-fold pyridoxal phosphate-dependent enzyme [Dermatophilaceae bacterium]|nr:aminotransferase class I/II-fold pyridoxal phosphate-dependent enzyme [Dermatophilaceae bacterium]
MLVDLTDEQLRARAAAKWSRAPAGTVATSVAEMDFALAPVIVAAVHQAVERGSVGYPPPDRVSGVPEALAAFATDRWGWPVDPANVVLVPDTMGGVELALQALCDPGPVVVPTPAYPPFLDVVPHTGRTLVTVDLDPSAARAELDLDRIDAALADGARTVLLCQPHNPWGRVFGRAELEGLRDVVARHGARVVSDEVHGPLVLPGARHLPYAALAGTTEHAVTVVSAAKGWNIPGLKSAQLVASPTDASRLRALPHIANHGSTHLGQVANRTAYEHGGPWLDEVLARLHSNRALFGLLVRERLPRTRMRWLEATYLAWLDVRGYDVENPARTVVQRGGVHASDGAHFGPGGAGHLRVNLATSPERLERIVAGLASALEG